MGEHQQHRALPLGRQRRPQGCTRLTGLAHGVTPATEPAPGALPDRFSVICRSPSNYQRQHVWDIEQTFRTAKHLLATRPIFHKLDETIRGHVFCSFLALVLKKALDDRIAAVGRAGWPQRPRASPSDVKPSAKSARNRLLQHGQTRRAASLASRRA